MKSRLLAILIGWVLAAFALADGSFGQLNQQVKGLSDGALLKQVGASPVAKNDGELKRILTTSSSESERANQVRKYIALREDFERPASSATTSTPITDIKRSPLYRKAAENEGGNWLEKAMDRLPSYRPQQQNTPDLPTAAAPGLLNALSYVVIGILAIAVLVCLFFAIRHFAVNRTRRVKKSKAILEEDEPERSADEWLELAASLEREGRYREAIRCLYVASLLRLDEHRVIRFDRTQTNWEHYRRLTSSPKNPKQIDLLSRTREFDKIWYGGMETSPAEVQTFRGTYQDLTNYLNRPGDAAA